MRATPQWPGGSGTGDVLLLASRPTRPYDYTAHGRTGDDMPTARPTRCPEPGCHRLTTQRGRCDEHQRKPWANPSANTRILTSADRARFRRMVLARDPVCVCTGWCGTHYGPCTSPATEADHIVPIGLGGAHHAGENGQGLCAQCHGEKNRTDNQRIRQARTRRGTP